MSNQNMDDSANKGTEQTKKAASSVGKKAFKYGKKATSFLIRKILAFLGLSLPALFGFMILVSVIGAAFYFGTESRGTDQEYELSRPDGGNTYSDVINEYGDPEITQLSEDNAFLQIFYENEVDKSYWKYYINDDGETVLDYGNNVEPFNSEVKDRYGREKYFQLNAMSLYALDEHLNDNRASTPQTFIQHVPFEVKESEDGEVELEGIDLTDEDGELLVESQAFEVYKNEKLKLENEGIDTYRRKYNSKGEPEMVKGVWDYGLAPVYHYKEFEEKRETRNEITGGQIWDVASQQMRKMTADEVSSYSSSSVPPVTKKESEQVFMIKDAVTPMGTIKNEIEQVWQESGKIVTENYSVTQNVQVRKTREVKVPKIGSPGSGRGDASWRDDANKGPVSPRSSNNPTISNLNQGSMPEDTGNDGEDEQEYNIVTETYYVSEPREHLIEVKGVEWEFVPRYIGEPDTEDLDALGYYIDYFSFYDNYVDMKSLKEGPFTYLETAKLQEKLGIELSNLNLRKEEANYDEEALGFEVVEYGIPPTIEERMEGEGAYIFDESGEKITKPEHPLMKAIRELQLKDLEAGGLGSVSGVEFGVESDSQAVQNASRFLPQFIEYGNRYGVDPMLLMAIAAQETDGHHEQTSNYDGYKGIRRSYTYKGNGYADKAAIGLMQVLPDQKNPSKTLKRSAFNHDTGQMETLEATQEELHNLETNIQYATMHIAWTMKFAKFDVITGLASYHHGVSFAKFVQTTRPEFGEWSPEAIQPYLDASPSHNGIKTYVQDVLKMYLPAEGEPYPWTMDEEGEKHTREIDGGIGADPNAPAVDLGVAQTVGRRPTGNNSKVKNGIIPLQKIVKVPFRALSTITGWIGDGITQVSKWFNIPIGQDKRDYYRVGMSAREDAAYELFLTMLAYDEGLNLSDYEHLDKDELVELMLEKYMKNLTAQDNIGMNINPLDYFPEGHRKPVDKVDILVKFGDLKRGHKSQTIQLAVPGSAKIYAVADGIIKDISENSISIDHGGGIATVYEGVGRVVIKNMKVGDEIKKGTVIATGSANQDDMIEKDAFIFALYNNGRYEDPTWIIDPGLLTSGGDIDPSTTSFMHPYHGRDWVKNSDFGWRIHPIYGTRRFHDGTDYRGNGKDRWTNMDILAPSDAIVNHSGWINGFGNTIVLEYPQMQQADGRKVYTLIAHMVRPSPHSKGSVVKKGQHIGNEGESGNVTGPHIHLELIIGHGDTWHKAKNGKGESANIYNFHDYLDKEMQR